MKHSQETKDYAVKLREEGMGIMKVKERLLDDLGVDVGKSSIAERSRHIRSRANEAIDQLTESLYDNRSYDYNDEALFVFSSKVNKFGEREKVRFEIPFSIMNELQRKYVRKGSNRTQQQIINNNRGTEDNPLYIDGKAWNAIKSALDLNKHSGICNKVFLKIIEDKYGEDAVDNYIDETALSTERQRHIDIENKSIDRNKEKLYKQALRFLTKQELQLQAIQENISKHIPKKVDFKLEKPKNNDKAYIVLTDIHMGRTSNIVKERLGKVLSDIRNMNEGHIVILNLGDNTESIGMGSGLMHESQMSEMDIIGSDQLLAIVDLFEEFVMEIYKMGKTVSIKGLAQSNHDRASSSSSKDPERLVGVMFFELLKRGLREIGDVVEYFREAIGTFDDDNLRFIMHHGDKGFNNKKTPRILFGDQGSDRKYNVTRFSPDKYHVVLSGHYHKHEVESGPSYTRIQTPSPNEAGTYADQEFLSSNYPGYTVIKPTQQAIDVLLKSLI